MILFDENTVRANLLAAMTQVYNAAFGGRTTLNTLFKELVGALAAGGVVYEKFPLYRDFRAGDVRHSPADIGKIARFLGYAPTHGVKAGIAAAMSWYTRTPKLNAREYSPKQI